MNPATLAYILAGLKILDEIIRLIPDKYLAAHTTAQAVTNAIKALAAWASRPGPAAGAVALALLLASSPAMAEGPQLRAPMPADVLPAPVVPPEAIVPPACPEPCAACASRVGSALVPAGQPMPTWLKAVLGVGVALGGALTVYQQGRDAGTW